MRHLNNLKKLMRASNINLKIEQNAEEIKINEVPFYRMASKPNLNLKSKPYGLLLNPGQEDLKSRLRSRGISCLDSRGNLDMITNTFQLNLIGTNSRPRNKVKLSPELSVAHSPTLLVSPHSFAIIDTLMRLTEDLIVQYSSPFQFCKAFNLYQSKISQIMSHLDAKNLIELRKKIKIIPLDWWLLAFDTPLTRRKMTPFFTVAQPYFSIEDSNLNLQKNLAEEMSAQKKTEFIFGPSEVAKGLGYLIDDEISLWATTAGMRMLKKKFKLVPGHADGKKSWWLATPKRGFEKESINSNIHFTELKNEISQESNNLLRAAWDLSFTDSRTREVRKLMLRGLFK